MLISYFITVAKDLFKVRTMLLFLPNYDGVIARLSPSCSYGTSYIYLLNCPLVPFRLLRPCLFSWLDGKQMDVFCMLKRQVHFVMTHFSTRLSESNSSEQRWGLKSRGLEVTSSATLLFQRSYKIRYLPLLLVKENC